MSDIHPEMRIVVAWLNAKGFTTTDSGDGVTNVRLGMEGALDFPHVFMTTIPARLVSEARRLALEIQEGGIDLDGVTRYVQATYNPTDGEGVLMLAGIMNVDFERAWADRRNHPAGEAESNSRT